MFDTLQDRLHEVFKNLRGKSRLTEADIDATAREIRLALLEADVNLGVVKEFIANLKSRALGADVHKALNPSQQIIKIVDEELVAILGGEARPLRFAKRPPTVIMLAGLQGSGKTTLAGKLGLWLKGQGHSPLLVAADLQRPNAVNQLQVVGERAGVHVYAPEPGNGVGDPVQVARQSILHAMSKLYDVVVVDTAGRLGIDSELMQQAADIRAAVNPTEVLFVVDAMIGQDAVNTASAFADGVGFDGVVLTKLDGDARGGAALSVRAVTGAPVKFVGVSEKIDGLETFHPERMASRILGMGDVLSLVEQAQRSVDADEAKKLAKKVKSGKGFDLEDFRQQIGQMRRMGGLAGLVDKLPAELKAAAANAQVDERRIARQEGILSSMTREERAKPELLKASRKRRIAAGAGVPVQEVNQLLAQFEQAQKMMKLVAKGGMHKMMRGMRGLLPGR